MVIQAYSFNEARYKCTQHRDALCAGKQGSGTKRSTNDGWTFHFLYYIYVYQVLSYGLNNICNDIKCHKLTFCQIPAFLTKKPLLKYFKILCLYFKCYDFLFSCSFHILCPIRIPKYDFTELMDFFIFFH